MSEPHKRRARPADDWSGARGKQAKLRYYERLPRVQRYPCSANQMAHRQKVAMTYGEEPGDD